MGNAQVTKKVVTKRKGQKYHLPITNIYFGDNVCNSFLAKSTMSKP
jgi:hypothetical protein